MKRDSIIKDDSMISKCQLNIVFKPKILLHNLLKPPQHIILIDTSIDDYLPKSRLGAAGYALLSHYGSGCAAFIELPLISVAITFDSIARYFVKMFHKSDDKFQYLPPRMILFKDAKRFALIRDYFADYALFQIGTLNLPKCTLDLPLPELEQTLKFLQQSPLSLCQPLDSSSLELPSQSR